MRKIASIFIVSFSLLACSSQKLSNVSNERVLSKIQFDLNQLDEEGLAGPKDGKVALHYEFCVPNTTAYIRAVQKIDPSLQIQAGSTGRIGCLRGKEVLCLGSTHQPNYRDILYQLASLEYIEKIQQTFFE